MKRKDTPLFAAILLYMTVASLALLPQTSYSQALRLMSVEPDEAFEIGANLLQGYPGKAAVVIKSDIRNLQFTSQGSPILAVRHAAGSEQYVLIVEPLVQEYAPILVDAPNFATNRFRHPVLGPGEVSYWEIKSTRAVQTLASVRFRLEPDDARLFIDGDPYHGTDGPIRVPSGLRTVRVEREGYETYTSRLLIGVSRPEYSIALKPLQGIVTTVESNPSNALVLLDDREVGRTDSGGILQFETAPGTYELTVIRSGFDPITREVTITSQGANRFNFDMVADLATLFFEVTPGDATVTVNGRDAAANQDLYYSPGRYTVVVSKPGFSTVRDQIDTRKGERIVREYALVAEKGSLTYSVIPGFSTSKLYNSVGTLVEEWVGYGNIGDLPAGYYTISSSARGYESKQYRIQIVNGEVTELSTELTPAQTLGDQAMGAGTASGGRRLNPWSGLVIPGSSHILSGRKRGWIYLAGTLAAGAYAYQQWTQYQDWSDTFDARQAAYDAASTETAAIAAGDALKAAETKRNDYFTGARQAVFAAGGIYGASILDMSLTSRRFKKMGVSASFSLDPIPPAMRVPAGSAGSFGPSTHPGLPISATVSFDLNTVFATEGSKRH